MDCTSLDCDECADQKYSLYSLDDILKNAGLPVQDNEKSDDACCRYIRNKLSDRCSYEINGFLESLNSLPTLYCNSGQKPDVMVFDINVPNLPVILVQLHSSPFQQSIVKCIIGVVDQLRLYRSYDSSITTCTGYVFPKLGVKRCVVKVQVTWSRLVFLYKLTPTAMEQIDLEATVRAASVPSTDNVQKKHFLVTLSQDDLQLFGPGAFQKPSKSSILVNCNGTFYKYPLSVDKRNALGLLPYNTANPYKINFRVERKGCLALTFFKLYDAVKYNPLTDEEAHRCLKDLMSNLHVAIEAYHSDGWAHADIRLENVCFNSNFLLI